MPPRAALLLACLIPALAGCAGPAQSPMEDEAAPSIPATAAHTPAPARLLVFTRARGWRHDSIDVAVDTVRDLAAAEQLAIVHSEDATQFNDATLRGFRAVVFANTTHDVLDEDQQRAFERFVRGGGGFVGIHGAADTEHDWPWYGSLVGARFASHPPGLQTTDVHFTSGPDAGTPWRVTDELYDYDRNPRRQVTVIATVDERQYTGGRMGDDHPIAWCHARFGGRAWYTGLGHDRAIYGDPTFRAHLARGLRFASGLADEC